MHNKTPIKVIKKNAVRIYKTREAAKHGTARNTGREIAATVSGWVREFQLRSKESKPVFDSLFAQN